MQCVMSWSDLKVYTPSDRGMSRAYLTLSETMITSFSYCSHYFKSISTFMGNCVLCNIMTMHTAFVEQISGSEMSSTPRLGEPYLLELN